MKPKMLCRHMPPELFEKAALKDQAARFCMQCPSKNDCFFSGVSTDARAAMWGGVWFTDRGEHRIPDQPKDHDPIRWLGKVDEDLLETRLRMTRTSGVQTRHEVWKIGTSCQNLSFRHGDPCRDPICRTIRRGQDRMRKLRKLDEIS